MSYAYWTDAIAGKKPKAIVDQCELGFYRKSISERNEKGNSRRIGWEPVAVFMDGDVMVARVGNREVTDQDKLADLWSWIASNPISEAEYRRVAESGLDWSDAHDPSKNKPREAAEPTKNDSLSPEEILIALLVDSTAGVSQYTAVDSDTMAGQALSLKNEITDIAGKLDKVRESLVRPHIDAQREVNDRLNPIIKDAKAQAQALLRAIGGWEYTKREAQRAAEAAQRRKEEDERKAREWHDATPAGAVPEPLPPSGPPIKSNAPPPSTQVAAAVGRKASVKVKQFVVSIDEDKAFAQFKGNAELSALLISLAQKAIDAGLPVPGAVTEERSVVR